MAIVKIFYFQLNRYNFLLIYFGFNFFTIWITCNLQSISVQIFKMFKKINDKNTVNSLVLFVDIILSFCITFVGDYEVFHVPFIFILWIILILRKRFRFKKLELKLQAILALIFLPIVIRPDNYIHSYYIAFIYPALYVNVVYFIVDIINRLNTLKIELVILKWLCFFVWIILFLITLGLNSQRNSLFFGPNIYYRILGVMSISYLISSAKIASNNIKSRKIVLPYQLVIDRFLELTVTIVSILCLLKTGSRGGFLVSFIIIFVFIFNVFKTNLLLFKKLKKKSIIISYLFVIASTFTFVIIILQSSSYQFINSRFLLDFSESRTVQRAIGLGLNDKDIANNSSNTRAFFLELMPDFLKKQNIFLGEGTFYIEKVTDGNLFYPHNLYLDLLYNSGVFLAALFIIFSAIYFLLIFKWLYLLSIFPLSVEKSTNSLKGKNNCHLILTLIFLPVYVGTLFSGTLYDNYSVLSVIICIPVMEFNSSKNIGLQNKNLVFKFKEWSKKAKAVRLNLIWRKSGLSQSLKITVVTTFFLK